MELWDKNWYKICISIKCHNINMDFFYSCKLKGAQTADWIILQYWQNKTTKVMFKDAL